MSASVSSTVWMSKGGESQTERELELNDGRSGSKGSLAGGCTGAVLMGVAYYLMQTPETGQIGYALGFGSSFLFASVFVIPLAATRKLAPPGPLLGLSVLALVVFISAYLQGTIWSFLGAYLNGFRY